MNEIMDFYERQYDEDGRAARTPLEFSRSREIISRYLTKEKMRVADIGGASGAYSFWLAELGHEVHLLDLAPRHIRQAKEKAQATGLALAGYGCGDARKLPYPDEMFDLVLEMGPLYHLQDRGDRMACLRESRRILKAGCPVACAVISRYASLMDGFRFGLIRDEAFRQILERDLETGRHDNPNEIPNYFTTSYFHTPEEIRSELEEAGFDGIRLIAVEGFANVLEQAEELSDFMAACLRKTESAPELLGVSGHILAVGYAPNLR